MENKAICIKQVIKKSVAKKAGIKAGDFLLSVNGKSIKDIFDYQYHISNENILVEISDGKTGTLKTFEIQKDIDDDLGLVFEKELIDDEKSCNNKCIFCFIDQLPKGMRESLYFKDDDARLSFLTGNYITLTNMSFKDVQRIADMHFSPINISVHTTDPVLRCSMLNNRFAGELIDKMEIFQDAGISMNCQIVLCKDVNDGIHLDKTLSDLYAMYPSVKSISVVPVGLTKYRDGLYPLSFFNEQDSKNVIIQIESHQKRIKEEIGYNLVYIADEFYINAKIDLPDYEHYDEFYQIENGVGMMSLFLHDAQQAIEKMENSPKILKKLEKRKNRISVATGELSYKYLNKITDIVNEYRKYKNIRVYPIKNEFFGGHVSVTGLLTGKDLIEALKDEYLGDTLLISETMLRAGTQTFLDDLTVKQVSKTLGIKIVPVQNNGASFVDALIV